jgi:hypothetical protein
MKVGVAFKTMLMRMYKREVTYFLSLCHVIFVI